MCFDGAGAFVEFGRLDGIIGCKPRDGADFIWAALRRLDIRIALRANWPRSFDEHVLSCVPGIPDGYFSGEIFRTASNGAAWPVICQTLAISSGRVLFLVGDRNRLTAVADFPHVMRLSAFLDLIRHGRLGGLQRKTPGGAILALLEAIRSVLESDLAVPWEWKHARFSSPTGKPWIGFRKGRRKTVEIRRWPRPNSRRPARLVRY